ncbi:hypothetical protein VL20_4131 [Microcystis panniformis FACHB-1757]|uniref:Uncharacterized protein n=1 Tax=Microcystis panniformis FACHB-1757 TaxID=1638788 RepID=A0A0K1S4T9_9CHRO|nr:hypothetical protein VL20_4131 [Microcystis panniformis FACHB-1757]
MFRSNSYCFNHLRPQVQKLQETPTLQRLREQQIRIIQTR